MHFSHDVLFTCASFLDLTSMTRVLLVCKYWRELDEQEAFWRQAYCALLAQELSTLSPVDKKDKARRAQIHDLRRRHIVHAFYREKGTQFKSIVQKQKRGFLVSSQASHVNKLLTIRITCDSKWSKFEDKWHALLSMIQLLKETYHGKTLLWLMCSNFNALPATEQNASKFLEYYYQVKKQFPNTHLAQVFESNSYKDRCMPYYYLLCNNEVCMALFDQFCKDIKTVTAAVPISDRLLTGLLDRNDHAPLSIVKQFVDSGVLWLPIFGTKEDNLVNPMLTNFRVSTDIVEYIMDLCFQEWDDYQGMHGQILSYVLRRISKSNIVKKILSVIKAPIVLNAHQHDALMITLMGQRHAMTEERFVSIINKLLSLQCSFTDKCAQMFGDASDAFCSFLASITEDDDPACIIRLLELMKPHINLHDIMQPYGQNYLFYLHYYNAVEVVALKWLLEHGVDPNQLNTDGLAPFFSVSFYANTDVILQSIDVFGQFGANFTHTSPHTNFATLVDICENGDHDPDMVAAVKQLVAKYNAKMSVKCTVK